MGDKDGTVHSFRGFNWYTLNPADEDLKLPDPDGRERSTCQRKSDMTNSPDENSPCTICGRTLIGWYKQEMTSGERKDYCWWGQKLLSSPHSHFRGGDPKPSFAEDAAEFADFAADGEVLFTEGDSNEGNKPEHN